MIRSDSERRAIVTVRCPHCRAAAGKACVVPSTGRELRSSGCHPSRVDALNPPTWGAA